MFIGGVIVSRRLLSFGVAVLVGLSLALPARALKLYRDKETGQVTTKAGPNQEKLLDLSISGKTYLQYRTELTRDPNAGATARKPYNAFESTRMYLTFKAGLGDVGKFKLTYDFRDQSGAEGYSTNIKYLFADLNTPIPGDAHFRFGQIPTVWVGREEHLWGYRVQGTIFSDREGYYGSTDRGVALKGMIPSLPLEYDVAYTNGEGYRTDEVNSGKAIQGRLTADLSSFLDGLSISGFGIRHNRNIGRVSTRYIAQGFYKNDLFRLGFDYMWTKDDNRADVPGANRTAVPATVTRDIKGKGFSLFGAVKVPSFEKVELFGRWDKWDPDDVIANNSHDRYIGGVSYKFSDNILFLLDYDEVSQDPTASLYGSADRKQVLLQSQVKF
ncbi:MAG: hypothetical protein D6679_00885 [Candidatus Hydrogenedentota bacterium]|nr:MAG: hypothetical protein D6679_00885 [Candidatus Hydrogenedentota bacterium]